MQRLADKTLLPIEAVDLKVEVMQLGALSVHT